MKKVKIHLEMDDIILRKWFHENHMVLNPGKYYYMVIGDTEPSHKIILNNKICSSSEEKLLGILLDIKLNFDHHITSLCEKAGQIISFQIRKFCY